MPENSDSKNPLAVPTIPENNENMYPLPLHTEKKRKYTGREMNDNKKHIPVMQENSGNTWRERTNREYRIGDIVSDPRYVTETTDEWGMPEEELQMMNDKGQLRVVYGGDND